MNRRVVVTGIGVVTPVGIGKEAFWSSLVAGTNGVGPVTRFDPAAYSSRIAAEVRDFDPTDFMDRKMVRRVDPFVQFSIAASALAIEDSGLDLEGVDRTRVGVFIGSGNGGNIRIQEEHLTLLKRGPMKVSPPFIPGVLVNMASSYVSIRWGLKGPIEALATACSTGVQEIGNACRTIRMGEADLILAGGAEAAISPLPFSGFCAMRAMSTRNDDPGHASRPFDMERDGFVMGEGAGVLILEEVEHARKRNADVYAEISGYGVSADAFHPVAPAPDGEGARRAMEIAIKNAGLAPSEVDYVNAHGTSTPLNDVNETRAIKALFGEHAARMKISSNKSMFGHLLGAAGAVEAAATALTLREQFIPPTINYRVPDPECDLDYVPNEGVVARVRHAICNSFGFGGINACAVFSK